MKHLDAGRLRQSLDEPEALNDAERRHLETCETCRAERDQLSRNVRAVTEALAERMPRVDPQMAYANVERRLATPVRSRRRYIPALGLGAAAAIVLALFLTPLGGYADAFLTIFQPKTFVPVDVTSAELRELRIAPQADQLGFTQTIVKPERREFTNASDARAQAGFEARLPSSIPAEVGSAQRFSVSTPGLINYTFSAAKARAFETKSHKTLPPMPAALDGTTLHISIGNVLRAEYGTVPHEKKREPGDHFVEVVEMQAPAVRSSGASFEELERYMLSLPGISPELAAQLRTLHDLQTHVPIPVNVDKDTAHQVHVDGAEGLAIGDNTGLGAGVMWTNNDIVYGIIGGGLTMDQVLALANGLR